jgi:outer membrane protein OmpA-like peptidoglycan-associated protein
MLTKCLWFGFAWLLLSIAGCAPKPAPAPAPPPPPPPKQNLVVLLPDQEGRPSSIAVTNSGGAQTLTAPYQAVRVENSSTAPTPPFTMDQADVRRVFGAALDTLPTPEVSFTLYFVGDSDVLVPESKAKLQDIMAAIRERHSTAISLIGHTDTMGDSRYNEGLGRRRAEAVAKVIREQGVDASSLFAESHGDADLAVKTARGVDEPRNRRVQVIIR